MEKPFNPPPLWQLQDNQPAASARSLRWTPLSNIPHNLRSSVLRPEHKRCRVPLLKEKVTKIFACTGHGCEEMTIQA